MCKTKKILAVIGLFFVLSVTNAFATPTPVLRLDIVDPEISVGQTFSINVIAEDVALTDEVLAFGFDTIYSSSFTFIDAAVGDGFYDDSNRFDDILVAGSAFPGISGGSDILLSTLSFRPSLEGDFSLVIYSDLGSPDEGLFTLDFPQVDISTLISIEVVPVPPAISLFGSVLVGCMFFRRKADPLKRK